MFSLATIVVRKKREKRKPSLKGGYVKPV